MGIPNRVFNSENASESRGQIKARRVKIVENSSVKCQVFHLAVFKIGDSLAKF